MQPTHEQLSAALLAADAAGDVLRTWFRAPLQVDHKDAPSPIVTEADLAAERAIRDVLAKHTPQAGIEGEELGIERADAAWRWVIDPIDGTIAFACGKPLFTTLVALLHEGRPVLGLIDQPIVGERWVGTAEGTTLNGQPVQVRTGTPVAHARVACTAPSLLGAGPLLERLRAEVHVISWGGDAYNYGALAAGQLDVVIERGLAPHDYAALVPVVRGAGGRVTDWSGRDLEQVSGDASVLATGCPALHDEVLGWIREAGLSEA